MKILKEQLKLVESFPVTLIHFSMSENYKLMEDFRDLLDWETPGQVAKNGQVLSQT